MPLTRFPQQQANRKRSCYTRELGKLIGWLALQFRAFSRTTTSARFFELTRASLISGTNRTTNARSSGVVASTLTRSVDDSHFEQAPGRAELFWRSTAEHRGQDGGKRK